MTGLSTILSQPIKVIDDVVVLFVVVIVLFVVVVVLFVVVVILFWLL